MVLFNNSSLILNLIIISLFLFFLIVGYKKGFVKQLFKLMTLFASLMVANLLHEAFGAVFKITPKFLVPFQDTILEQFFYTKINSFVWFIIIFVITLIFLKFLSVAFDFITKVPVISSINKWLGMVFGVLNFVLVSYIMIFIISMPIFTNGVMMVENSLLSPVVKIVNIVVPSVTERLDQFGALDSFITIPSKASVEDVEKLSQYLSDNGVSINEISQFMQELGK